MKEEEKSGKKKNRGVHVRAFKKLEEKDGMGTGRNPLLHATGQVQ